MKNTARDNELANCTAIIVAAGVGSRAKSPSNDSANQLGSYRSQEKQFCLEKQFWPLAGKTVLAHSVDVFQAHPRVKTIIIVTSAHNLDRVRSQFGENNCHVIQGGATRQQSVYAGLQMAADIDPAARFVAIHDAARPLLPAGLLSTMLATINDDVIGVAPALPLADTLSLVNAHEHIDRIVDRAPLRALQTPQLFWRKAITDLHKHFADEMTFTDDCGLALAAGHAIATVDGTHQLLKLTHLHDYAILKSYCNDANGTLMTEIHGMPNIRIGNGFDVHKFADTPGPIMLAGLSVDYDRGMLAHSDGDVALHAICDAIFGALADGDIGHHFPPSDPQWRAADSSLFLKFAADRVYARGGQIMNLDLTIICETPKIGPLRDKMRARIAKITNLPLGRIAVKATTSEKLGFTGRGEGIAAQATAAVILPDNEDQFSPAPTAP